MNKIETAQRIVDLQHHVKGTVVKVIEGSALYVDIYLQDKESPFRAMGLYAQEIKSAPKMKLKDITQEQAIELVNLAFPSHNDTVIGKTGATNIRATFIPETHEYYEDIPEHFEIRFDGSGFGSKTYPCELEITPKLNCFLFASYKDEHDKLDVIRQHHLPLRSQHKIFSKFREWGLEPEDKGTD